MSVKQFVETHRNDVLRFHPSLSDKEISFINFLDDRTFVKEISGVALRKTSVNTDDQSETSVWKRRSALDIWRHCKYFRSISIYKVMNILHDLLINNEIQCGFVCSDINRRVFRIDGSEPVDNFYLQKKDEFGLYFSEWENISEETDV